MRSRLLTAVLLALSCCVAAHGETTITSGPTKYYIGSFGYPDTTTYGQTFDALGDLNSFSFDVASTLGGDADFVVASISGATPGAAIYSSLLSLATGTNTVSGLSVPLTPGTEYIAYVTIAGLPDPVFGAIFDGNDGYSDGQFLYSNTHGVDPTGIPMEATDEDLTFSATFDTAVTPEPASFALFGTGLLGIAGVVKRRYA